MLVGKSLDRRRKLLQKMVTPMLLVVASLLVTSLVPVPCTISLLLLLPLQCRNLLLFAVANTDHAHTTIGTTDDLATTTAALLTIFHLCITIFIVLWCGETALCVLHTLSDAGIVAQVLSVVLVERPMACCSARGEVQFVFVVVYSSRCGMCVRMEAICGSVRPGVGVVVMSRFVKTLMTMSAIDRHRANFVCWYTRNCAISLPAFVILAAGHFCIVLCGCLRLAPCAKLHATSCG